MAEDAANLGMEVLYVRLPGTLMNKLRMYAFNRSLTVAAAIRELLEQEFGKIWQEDDQ